MLGGYGGSPVSSELRSQGQAGQLDQPKWRVPGSGEDPATINKAENEEERHRMSISGLHRHTHTDPQTCTYGYLCKNTHLWLHSFKYTYTLAYTCKKSLNRSSFFIFNTFLLWGLTLLSLMLGPFCVCLFFCLFVSWCLVGSQYNWSFGIEKVRCV